MLAESKYAPAEPLVRVLTKGKRELTDEDRAAIRLVLNESFYVAGAALGSLEKWPQASDYATAMRVTVRALEKSPHPDHIRCAEAERLLRQIAHKISELATPENKLEPWVEDTRATLFKMAGEIRYALNKVGHPVPLFEAGK